jgi:hypothetical protein
LFLEGVLLDMDNRTIAWSFDGKLFPTVNLPGDFTRLYPAVSLYQTGDWVTIHFNAAIPPPISHEEFESNILSLIREEEEADHYDLFA